MPNISAVGAFANALSNPTSDSWDLSAITWRANDCAVFWWYTFDNTKTLTPPGTITSKQDVNSAGFGHLFIGYRILQAGDSNTYSYTSSSVVISGTVWGASVFRSALTSGDPFEAQSGTPATFTNTASPDPPAVTTLSANAMVVTVVGINHVNSGVGLVAPTTYTTLGADGISTANSATCGLAYLLKAAIGVEDPGVWSGSGTGLTATDDGYLWTGALQPLVLTQALASEFPARKFGPF